MALEWVPKLEEVIVDSYLKDLDDLFTSYKDLALNAHIGITQNCHDIDGEYRGLSFFPRSEPQ